MKLQEVCSYVVDKIDNSTLNINNYISTENMTPNCGGVTSASNVPDGKSIWFKEGDILFSNIRPYFKKLWKADISGGCSADVLCIRANEKINPTYLYYLLIQDSFISYVMKGTKGDALYIDNLQFIYNKKLSMLYIDGVELPDFSGDRDEYVCFYDPKASPALPYVDATTESPRAEVSIRQATMANPVAEVTVTHDDVLLGEALPKVYRILFLPQNISPLASSK